MFASTISGLARAVAVAATLSLIAAAAPVTALAQTAPQAPVKVNVKGNEKLALQGYDPVAYFTENKAVKGSKDFTAQHQGATYYFASAQHRDAFAAEPAKYVPQYGGFCAYGVTKGYQAPIEPDAFAVVDGKLYLNYDKDVQKTWAKDIPGYIAKADQLWPTVAAK